MSVIRVETDKKRTRYKGEYAQLASWKRDFIAELKSKNKLAAAIVKGDRPRREHSEIQSPTRCTWLHANKRPIRRNIRFCSELDDNNGNVSNCVYF